MRIHRHEKEKDRQTERHTETERQMGETERQADGKKERCFNETRDCCMMHYDHSVWPANKDDDLA